MAVTSEMASSEVPRVRRHLRFVPLLMMLSFFLINQLVAQDLSCGSKAFGFKGSVVAVNRHPSSYIIRAWLPHGVWNLSSQTLCIRRQVFNHWTPGDVIFDHLVKVVSAKFLHC